MTTPPPPPPSDLQALLEEHADLILALELAAGAAVTKDLVAQLGRIQRDIAATWIRLVGALTGVPTLEQSRTLAQTLINALLGVRTRVSPRILRYARRAARLGARQARQHAGMPTRGVTARVSPRLVATILTVDNAVQDRIDTAVTMLRETPPTSWGAVTDALSVANQARGAADAAARTAVNTAANAAVAEQAEQVGARLLWLAERDACVACLAYAGELSDPGGGGFRIGLTFGKRPVLPWPDPNHLPGPPLHRWCRCRLMLWFGHDTQAAAAALPEGARTAHVDMPAALKREAVRSILRGFSLPSESERLRLWAAERALARKLVAPKSVKQYARAAIRRGRWPTRDVPRPP